MQERRTLLVLDHLEVFPQETNIVSIDRSDVLESEFFEEHAPDHTGLDPLFDLGQEFLGRIAEHRDPIEYLGDLLLEPGVEGVGAQAIEVVCQGTDARTNRHFVVVEHDDQIFVQFPCVVHGFKYDSRGKCPVADDRDAFAAFLIHQIVAGLKPQSGRDAAACMSGHEQIVRTLLGVGVTHESTAFADRAKLLVAARDQFVRIDLMAGIPDQPIELEVKDAVKG